MSAELKIGKYRWSGWAATVMFIVTIYVLFGIVFAAGFLVGSAF